MFLWLFSTFFRQQRILHYPFSVTWMRVIESLNTYLNLESISIGSLQKLRITLSVSLFFSIMIIYTFLLQLSRDSIPRITVISRKLSSMIWIHILEADDDIPTSLTLLFHLLLQFVKDCLPAWSWWSTRGLWSSIYCKKMKSSTCTSFSWNVLRKSL